MKIKTKLYIGIGLLFLMILILGAVSTLYVNSMKKDTENVLSANYNSVEYARNMLRASDKLAFGPQALAELQQNMKRQEANVTEGGEREITDRLAKRLRDLSSSPQDNQLAKEFRTDLIELMTVNMNAIVAKSDHAKEMASNAFILISVVGALCFLIGFVLFVNLPNHIADPIRKLTASIKEIAQQNYSQRVHIEGQSEFAELASSFNSMAERLQEYANSKLDQILEEKKRIETLINSMHDPVIGLDQQRRIVFINDEALQVAGMQRIDIAEKATATLYNKNELLNQVTNPNADANFKIYGDQKEQYYEREVIPMDIIPTGEQTKQQIGELIVLKNITTFKELDVAKTNFIATVSHELKTPIASIQLSAELLKHPRMGKLNPDQQHILQGIEEDSVRLLKITSELLNMSQVETGNIKLFAKLSDPRPIIDYAVKSTRMQAEQKNIQVQVVVQENVPQVFVDEEKTAWVMTNFLSNAIRYSTEHSEIKVSLKKENDMLVFAVQDFGKGIDASYKDRVFDRYFQIPGSMRTGTGLGLSISKDFINNQNGIIGVDSELGLGSTFFFKLPIPKVSEV